MLRSLASSSGWLTAAALLGLSGMASSLGACVAGSADSPNGVGGFGGGPGTGGTGLAGGSGGTAGVALSLEFVPGDPLSLRRRQRSTLTVRVEPPGEHVVRFALLPGPDSTLPADASLNATDLTTSPDGLVQVILTAPSAPTTFLVRASTTAGLSAIREVRVPETGMADLRVEAVYTGDRAWTRWSATATPNQTCATLPGGPLDDNLDWTDAPGTVVELLDVPADMQLAVVIRAEHFAWGCATIPAAVEGMDNHVRVLITNVPIKLADSEISISLDLATFQTAFQTGVEPSIVATLAHVPGAGDDVSALLDRMQAESGSDEASFVSARAAGAWDAAVRTVLGSGAATALRDPLERWMRSGLSNTSAGRFIGTIGAEGSAADGALLTLETVAGLPPGTIGFSAENDATWYSESPEDDVFFGSTLEIDPSTLLLGGAVAPAITEVDGAETLAEALASALSCDAVAVELVARGAATQVSYPGCNETCTRSLCESALEGLVTELSERDEQQASSLELAAAAVGTVGSEAELVGLEGTWVGSLLCEGDVASVGGGVLAPAP